MTKRALKALGAALATASLMTMATSAHADIKCRSTITKESAKATQAIAKNLQKCEQGVHDGKLTGPCATEPGTAAKIQKVKDKLKAAINKTCATSNGEFAFGRCPNETGTVSTGCGNILIQDKDTEGDCLFCLANHNATELVSRVLYGSLDPTPNTDDIGKCQAAIGKNTAAYYVAASKALAKCQGSLSKGKVSSCPDQKTSDALAKAEAKKQSAIAKACCGPDGICGGATCSITASVCHGGANNNAACSADSECPGGLCGIKKTVCQGGTNNQHACSADSACPGGTCVTSATETRCSGGSNGGQPCLGASECPGGTCPAGPAPCEAESDCGRCLGSTSPGKPCRSSGQCDSDPGNCNSSLHKCVGGSNPGTACTFPAGPECLGGGTCSSGVCAGGPNFNNACNTALRCVGGANNGTSCAAASECPGGACNGNFDCPSTAGGTCVGVVGICGGSDDFKPITDVGFPSPFCPGLTTGGAPIKLTGVTGDSILGCVDPQALNRAQCQDAAGATFSHDGTVPPYCVDTPVDCAPTGPTHTATVVLSTSTPLAGVSVNLGYKGVNFPGTGEVTGSPLITSTHPLPVANDNDDSLTLSVTDLGTPIANLEHIFTVTFSDCGVVPTAAANFGCIVRSASDSLGADIQDHVSCTVTVP